MWSCSRKLPRIARNGLQGLGFCAFVTGLVPGLCITVLMLQIKPMIRVVRRGVVVSDKR